MVNDLAVPVHDVHLTLTPGQPRLRIEQQPGPLRIGAKSRTNVPLQVTSIAAGLVPIEAVLTTPNGTPLGQNARVDVRVQPTSTWIYWALGAVAGIILVLGTYRSLRRGSTRASRPAAQETPSMSEPVNQGNANGDSAWPAPPPVWRPAPSPHGFWAWCEPGCSSRSWEPCWPVTPGMWPTPCPTSSTCCSPVASSTRSWSRRSPAPPAMPTADASTSTVCSPSRSPVSRSSPSCSRWPPGCWSGSTARRRGPRTCGR